MLRACSHAVVASPDVGRVAGFFREVLEQPPHYEHRDFVEFVLPSGFRLAFFRPTGPAAARFRAEASRDGIALGLTVPDPDALHRRVVDVMADWGADVSGPPKDHPWGERSFLLVDPDGNRWEITRAPRDDGMLADHEGTDAG